MDILKKKIDSLSATQIVVIGFFSAILFGAILLSLPIASRSGEFTPFIDALFTATTSVCVTGLTVVTTVEHWNIFGQIVILVLIQFGGLGVITVTTAMLLVLGRKVTLKDRLLIQESYSLNTLSGLVKLTKRILVGTFFVEGAGAIFYAFQFIPEFGLIKGIWISVFNAISAFCNAGIDIIGNNSLTNYVNNPLINIVTMILIVAGGLGFTVWWDCIRVGKMFHKKEIKFNTMYTKLALHSKVVLAATGILILSGAVLVFALEYNNPNTLGGLSLGGKTLASFFQSVTTRTAGFLSVPQEHLTVATSFCCIILMLIGGSPVGTAGGVKTVNVAILVATVMSVVKGNKDVTLFKRKLPPHTIKKCLAIISINLFFFITATLLLSITNEVDLLTGMYETSSALATVGLSKNLTMSLNTAGKIIIIGTMFVGRVGAITMAVAFKIRANKKSLAQFPEEDILIG